MSGEGLLPHNGRRRGGGRYGGGWLGGIILTTPRMKTLSDTKSEK